MRCLVILLVMLLSPMVSAGEINLIFGSFHITDNNGITHNDRATKPKYNEINPGISYTTNKDVSFGVFINSYEGVAVFAGKRFERGNFGLDLGVAHYGKYKFKNRATVVPIVQMTYDVHDWRIGFSPLYSTSDENDSYAVFTLQYVIPTDW